MTDMKDNEVLRVTPEGQFVWHEDADRLIAEGDFSESPAMPHILKALRRLHSMEHEAKDCLKITMEQQGCLIEAIVPEVALPPILQMKEYMQNTGADMYARLYHMMQQQKGEDGPGHQDAP